MIKKIVAIGPESTGKSTLCKQLAEHFNATWCPEYAREYLHQNGVKYGYDDLIKITQGQLAIEDYCIEKLQASGFKPQVKSSQLAAHSSQLTAHHSPLTTHQPPLLFLDTNMYVMKVWYEYVFGKCEHIVLDEISKRNYDLYLLCNIDLPWTADEMREYPDEQPRIELYNMYKDLLINQTTPWVEISGNYEERLRTAIEAVKRYCF
jgi:nicotinamide riboside kinase